jgi:hypothetical protein
MKKNVRNMLFVKGGERQKQLYVRLSGAKTFKTKIFTVAKTSGHLCTYLLVGCYRIDETDGLNVNTIEGFWRHMNDPIKRVLGTSRPLIPSYIEERVFRYNNGVGNRFIRSFWSEVHARYSFCFYEKLVVHLQINV